MVSKFWFPLLALTLLLEACSATARDRDVSALPLEGTQSSQNSAVHVQNGSSMARGDVKIDKLAILTSGSFPPAYELEVVGSLPTACHQLHAAADTPTMDNAIHVQIFSEYDPHADCSPSARSFDVSIPLGDYVRGSYAVIVNDREVGQITP
jgi:hypothetical protein